MGPIKLVLDHVVSMEIKPIKKSVMMATLMWEMDATLSASWNVGME